MMPGFDIVMTFCAVITVYRVDISANSHICVPARVFGQPASVAFLARADHNIPVLPLLFVIVFKIAIEILFQHLLVEFSGNG